MVVLALAKYARWVPRCRFKIYRISGSTYTVGLTMLTRAQHREGTVPEPPIRGTHLGEAGRIASVDALRGFVMFMMIFVNDLAGAGRIVPDWMVHFSDRHHGGSGMTFVDMVFPAFLFLVGMSVPLAMGPRLARGEPLWKMCRHVVQRTAALLLIGILMVHETPDTETMGWSGDWWCVLMYLSSIAAFCSIAPIRPVADPQRWSLASAGVRWAGLAATIALALAFRGRNGQRIVTLVPLSLDTQWYGILGLIGWAYLVSCLVYLNFGGHRTAILGCMALLMCLFAADRRGLFEGFWLNRVVGMGGTLGSQGAIAVGGLLLGSMLTAPDLTALGARTRFVFWFVVGSAAAALLLAPSYGISKNQATPAWCFWACAITGTLWYGFYWMADVHRVRAVARPLELAGRNVLLAYLISEMLPGLINALGLDQGYEHLAGSLPAAIIRSACCGVVILAMAVGLNRAGFRLRL